MVLWWVVRSRCSSTYWRCTPDHGLGGDESLPDGAMLPEITVEADIDFIVSDNPHREEIVDILLRKAVVLRLFSL